ncbi:MAG TPA: DUF1800 domain-containing protein [Gaiellaceae bacterium]|nr:DUF1800 domain-containing protein [Gaiellaceae bacterium]
MARLPVYGKRFGVSEAQRLLWRAGFGAGSDDAQALAKLGLDGAVDSLLNPSAYVATGPEPTDRGAPIAPADASGHDHLWWLDRMVRGNQPLIERMTLVWHDWFATSNQKVASQSLMLNQNQTMRAGALGSFHDLLLSVTQDPAMLLWLDGVRNTNRAPNENYGREMMELFTLGWSNGYTESDVREQARSLTGWHAMFVPGAGPSNFAYSTALHDPGTKTVFGQSGNFDWQDACRLCVTNPKHAAYFVGKLWSYFVATPPDAATQAALESLYSSGYEVKPVVRAILRHPQLYEGPRMVKQPVVYTAGLLRSLGRGVDSNLWTQLDSQSGQRLFYPPDVSGWDMTRWLDTATFRARWFLAANALAPLRVDERSGGSTAKPRTLLARATHLLGDPQLTAKTQHALLTFAGAALAVANPAVVENALRQLVAVSPDLQTA